MDLKAVTVATYNKSAEEFAEKFRDLGARVEDIEITLGLLGPRENVRAFEIGCGYGRDGSEIAKRVQWYHGIDISEAFIAMARERHPDLSFEVADAETYDFPPNIDAVFCFASLLHVSPDGVRNILRRLRACLADGGVVFLSLQTGEGRQVRDEPTGTRLYHLYTPEKILELADGAYERAYVKPYELRGRAWFEMVLRKKA